VSIRVLVVDDEPITAEAHAEYVRRLPGFEVAGVAHDGREAVHLCRRIRASGLEVDVIAITAVRDVAVVRASVSLGIVLYLIKPFTFSTFAEKLESYRGFSAKLERGELLATQSEVDASFATLRTPGQPQLDKGLSQPTLDAVIAAVRASDGAVSASELGERLELARVTARRYLEHLVAEGVLARSARYGTPGRPEYEYRPR
jgi:response regulator of citrate/malate metabolism